jgi:hypothetical protein
LSPDYRDNFIGAYEGIRILEYSYLSGITETWVTQLDTTSNYVVDVKKGIDDNTIVITYPTQRNDTIIINSEGEFESEYWVQIGNKYYFHYNVYFLNDSIDIYYDYDFGTEHSQEYIKGKKLNNGC